MKHERDVSADTRGSIDEPAAAWVAVDAVRPWADNPRKNDGEPVTKVAESIKRFGFGAPIVARSNGEIIAGHTRWKAAKHLGLERVPVRFLDLDEADAKLLALADNRLGEFAAWDDEAVLGILQEYSAEDADLAGWSEKDMEKLTARYSEAAEDESALVQTSFAVLIECADEAEQVHIIGACQQKGWKCRALI